ncbi:GNAT family N-acetyltransferase [Spirosoma spitsbergense]|uniref:GNAT family N-acetyltransferase n=1 Tax=Spirosoma spitsbergense TaxID=431554 RepID=UPI000377F5AD|nr:GNAT family N-acetyltransferase [Spirosoma spitsbergense]
MAIVKSMLRQHGQGAFKLYEDTTELGEMIVSVNGDRLTAYHTQVAPEAQGKGYAKQLLNAMVDYARTQHLRVQPLCPFVLTQFQNHPERYADLWTESVS